jgi:hypothetical protein
MRQHEGLVYAVARQQLGSNAVQRCGSRAERKEMPRWQGFSRWRLAGALMALAGGASCMTPGDPSATSPSGPRGSAAVDADEMCLVGRPTEEGIECQAFRADDGRLYTLIGDFGSLAGDDNVCVCGRPVEMSTCMQGTTIRVTWIGPPALAREVCPSIRTGGVVPKDTAWFMDRHG